MAGIFRSNSHNAPNESTPNKRYSLSAFCTSPGTLQDVTMENTFGVGYRSPCVSLQYQGSTSPAGQGRSVREFEEQMATLRKENFNLKLRLYFIEESIPGYQANSADGQEALSKQLIDAKVEMEMLRKEIQEKQDILKEAAQAMNQMEKIQKETECKSQAVVDELNHKIQYLEMEREMEKSHNGNFMNDLLGHSDISGNMNALHRIRELEGIVKQSEDRVFALQNQVSKLDNLLAKSDETIKEYEDKVKELVFQNAELLEALETKEKEMANAERIIRGLRLSNADLKEDNQNLADALKVTQSNFRSEMSNMKICERQMREQQETLCKMQSTIAIKTQNTARLLERIQDYEKMVTKMNFERNLAKRENRFFRAIIGKLQSNKTECYTIEKEFYEQVGPEYSEQQLFDEQKPYEPSFVDLNARGDYHREYKLKHKLCVNYCNHANFSTSSLNSEGERSCAGSCGGGLNEYAESDFEPAEIPIRYTISDVSLYGAGAMSKTNSCSSLHANISSSSVLAGSRELPSAEEVFIKEQQANKYAPVDGIRFVYSKFGNFQ